MEFNPFILILLFPFVIIGYLFYKFFTAKSYDELKKELIDQGYRNIHTNNNGTIIACKGKNEIHYFEIKNNKLEIKEIKNAE